MSQRVIEVDNLNKTFDYYLEKPSSIKEHLIHMTKGKFARSEKGQKEVLRDLSFHVNKGEFVGIMGRNGAGKSTLLKLITGIYTPTAGSIKVDGRIAPLLELGSGFNPELSGYENIYLNSSILGFSRKVMQQKVDEIIKFSGIWDSLHMPVKNYSSGMTVRLGFSVAVHLDADILIFDEVIGVGDAGFKEKCKKKIDELYKQGKTILLVSHGIETIKKYCSRVIVIDGHEKIYDGDIKDGTQLYLDKCGVEDQSVTY